MTHSATSRRRRASGAFDGQGTPTQSRATAGPAGIGRAGRAAAVERLEDRTLFAISVAPFDPLTAATELANRLLLPGTGITITGGSYVGDINQGGNYTGFDLRSGNNRLAINDGVVLTSGTVTVIPGQQNRQDQFGGQDDASGELANPGDPDLTALVGTVTSDANSLTVNFTTAPGVRSVLFDFVFGSEEFFEFVQSPNDPFGFNDAFAAYLDGTQISFDTNNNPITVNNNFFQLNNTSRTAAEDPRIAGKTGVAFDIEYDGLTPVIRTQAPVNTGLTTHTLKFVISDAGGTVILPDDILDSGVFISRLQGSAEIVAGPVTDLPQPGLFTFSPLVIGPREGELVASLQVFREGGASGLVTVDVFSSDGTATAGIDYQALPVTTLTFQDGQTTATVSIPIFNDALAEGDETFFVNLANATNAAGVGATPGEVRIIDDELGVDILQPVFTEQEGIDDVTVTITVILTGPAPAPVSVNFATVIGGTATAGVDYSPASGTLTFAPGETSKTFTFTVFDDFLVEETETVNIALSNVTSPFNLGEVSTAVLEILDLDRPPAVIDAQFVTNDGVVDGIALRFSEPMDEPLVEDLRNYDVFQRKEKKLGGAVTRTRQELLSAVYEVNTRTVTLTAAKPLRDNKIYEVLANTAQVQGIRAIDGDALDGNFDNFQGDDFTGYLSRVTRVNYFDEEGDRIGLQLKGPGKMELFRDVERNMRQVRMISTSQDTILTGTFAPELPGTISDGLAKIKTLFTGTGFRNRLAQPPFQIEEVIEGFQKPGT